jgi:hypothetical protein
VIAPSFSDASCIQVASRLRSCPGVKSGYRPGEKECGHSA